MTTGHCKKSKLGNYSGTIRIRGVSSRASLTHRSFLTVYKGAGAFEVSCSPPKYTAERKESKNK